VPAGEVLGVDEGDLLGQARGQGGEAVGPDEQRGGDAVEVQLAGQRPLEVVLHELRE